eukprot:751511-Hanusia_phi.AAC.2
MELPSDVSDIYDWLAAKEEIKGGRVTIPGVPFDILDRRAKLAMGLDEGDDDELDEVTCLLSRKA